MSDFKVAEREVQPAGKRRANFLIRNWHILLICAVTLSAFFVRIYYLSLHSEYTADSYYFLILARSIRSSFSYTVRGAVHTKYLPGFPVLIWLFGYLTGDLEKSANLISILTASLCVPLTYMLGREIFNKMTGAIACVLLAFMPTFLRWTCLPMTEGLFTFLFVAGVYLILTGMTKASPQRRLTGALLGGLAFVTRWEGVLFLPIAILIIVLYFKEGKVYWWEPVLMLVLYGLPLAIYVVRNLIAAGLVTAYTREYEQYEEMSFAILRHRFKFYAFQAFLSAPLQTLMYLGAFLALLKKKWKPFLILALYFSCFVFFHMFWYYTYERFMAPACVVAAVFIGFLLAELYGLIYKTNRRTSSLPEGRFHVRTNGLSVLRRTLALLFVFAAISSILVHSIARANRVIRENYLAFADDHGGAGMVDAARWFSRHAPGETVAVDAGPYFCWLHEGDVLYVRPVPWDLPVEDRDVDAPDIVKKLHERGVRYLLIGQTDEGLEAELETLSITQEERKSLKKIAGWRHRYSYPDEHYLDTVLYEILPGMLP